MKILKCIIGVIGLILTMWGYVELLTLLPDIKCKSSPHLAILLDVTRALIVFSVGWFIGVSYHKYVWTGILKL